jgi:hypothetical protein
VFEVGMEPLADLVRSRGGRHGVKLAGIGRPEQVAAICNRHGYILPGTRICCENWPRFAVYGSSGACGGDGKLKDEPTISRL